MKKVHVPSLAETARRSPAGKFCSYCKNVSGALGAALRPGQPGEVHPFDVQQRRVPPGAAICPYHAHTTQWELFVVLAGDGTVRVNGHSHPIARDDVFIHPPGTAHQTLNTSDADLEVLIVADNPAADIWYYPDSAKWGISPQRRFFRLAEVDYFDGEEPLAEAFPPPRPVELSSAPFKKVRIDDVPWLTWESPKKTFRGAGKQISLALGAVPDAPPHAGGHPFDLELGRLAPGETGSPFHSHAAQWEMFLIVSGTGTVRLEDGLHAVGPGDAVLHPPQTAHQISNRGAEDLLYFLVADNPLVDVWHYPDSNKWGFRPARKFFQAGDAVDYWAGEE